MNEPEPISSCSRNFNIRKLNSVLGPDRVDKMMEDLAVSITGTVRKLPGMDHFELKYRNILERDHNPDGGVMFFTATKYSPEDLEKSGYCLPPMTWEGRDLPTILLGE